MHSHTPVTTRSLLAFWFPLFATWIMMAVEGPFLAAVIARLGDAVHNLAAYGVAYSVALIVEAPVIMMLSASTALVHARHSYLQLRRFNAALSIGVTVLMIIVILPPVFGFIAHDLIRLPGEVARLAHLATALLLPWPGAIGVRRFYQGLLIRHNLTRRVAWGTIVRLTSMTGCGTALMLWSQVPGAAVGACALSAGVVMEALASRVMAHGTIRALRARDDADERPLTQHAIIRFYHPLALTSLLELAVHPMITFFIGQSRMPIESLAVLPVVTSLVFIFRSVGLSYHEVAVARLGAHLEQYAPVRRFAVMLGVASTAGLLLIAFTPLAGLWFGVVSGLTPQLADFAVTPTRLLVLMPAASVLINFQRAVLVATRGTAPITMGTALEVVCIIITLAVAIPLLGAVGAVAATAAMMIGRLAANAWLAPPMLRAIRAERGIFRS